MRDDSCDEYCDPNCEGNHNINVEVERENFKNRTGKTPEEWLEAYGDQDNSDGSSLMPRSAENDRIYFDALFLSKEVIF